MKNEKKQTNEELKKIVIERLKTMPEDLKVSLGDKEGFLSKDEIIENIENETDTGKQILQIQINYIRSLKKGVIIP